MNLLQEIKNPNDLKKLNNHDKELLAKEIRDFLIEKVSNTGGHLSSNLGVVELTITLLSTFNFPKDRIIFDVGHQSYVYKILTGRKEMFEKLRKRNGLSGFPKIEESIYDSANTGHSSTSLSLISGIARARDLKKEKYETIALIGDGALTGGMALEALNDIGSSNLNVKVILNDNTMSISKNVGGIPLILSKLRSRKIYRYTNDFIRNLFIKIPLIGVHLVSFARKIKRMIKQIFIHNMYFEDIGFTYLGPIDGHNIKDLEKILNYSKKIKGPVLIHVITKKGKGYKFAENNPDKYHAISSFDSQKGLEKNSKKEDYSKIAGETLCEIAQKNSKVVAITAAMKDGVGLKTFSERFNKRFFDVGICEEHAITLGSGMALNGLKPYILIYSSFLQRGYDQMIHDIALSNLEVVIGIDRTGIVGNDGETHQGIFTFSYLKTIPNMSILCPKDFQELHDMFLFTENYHFPICICYPKGGEEYLFSKHEKVTFGKMEVLEEGMNITIIALGKMVSRAMEVFNKLKENNISCTVINLRFLNPIDENIINYILKTKKVITIEDNILEGGLYTTILELLNKKEVYDAEILPFGYPKEFIKQGSIQEIEEEYQLDSLNIIKKINKRWYDGRNN